MRLRSEIKDNFTLKDMLGSVEKEMENRRENRMPGGGNYGMDEPEDTVSPESEIQRIRELIRRNEQTLGSGPLSGTEQPAPSAFREKETTDGEEEKPGKTEPEDTVPEETPGEDSTACALSGRTRGTSYGHSYIPHRRSWSERR